MRRLREYPTEAELAEFYSEPYDHKRWEDHKQRVQWTIGILGPFVDKQNICYAFDPACGDGTILRSLPADVDKHFGDLVLAPHVDVIGPLEDTIPAHATHWDDSNPCESLLILTEIIEHVKDPEQVLRLAHDNFEWLLLTTPINEIREKHFNPQHVWAWSQDEMRDLLKRTGWNTLYGAALNTFYYDYQLWICGRIK